MQVLCGGRLLVSVLVLFSLFPLSARGSSFRPETDHQKKHTLVTDAVLTQYTVLGTVVDTTYMLIEDKVWGDYLIDVSVDFRGNADTQVTLRQPGGRFIEPDGTITMSPSSPTFDVGTTYLFSFSELADGLLMRRRRPSLAGQVVGDSLWFPENRIAIDDFSARLDLELKSASPESLLSRCDAKLGIIVVASTGPPTYTTHPYQVNLVVDSVMVDSLGEVSVADTLTVYIDSSIYTAEGIYGLTSPNLRIGEAGVVYLKKTQSQWKMLPTIFAYTSLAGDVMYRGEFHRHTYLGDVNLRK